MQQETPEKYRERLRSSSSYIFGAYEENRLIGNVTLLRLPEPKTTHRATLAAMYVSPEYRGTGAGAKLLEAACRKARVKGQEQLVLSVVADNVPAVTL